MATIQLGVSKAEQDLIVRTLAGRKDELTEVLEEKRTDRSRRMVNDPTGSGLHLSILIEEIEVIATCLDEDAAAMLEENPEDERAHNMQRASEILTALIDGAKAGKGGES